MPSTDIQTQVPLGQPLPRVVKAVTALVQKNKESQIELYRLWSSQLNATGRAPINVPEKQSVLSLNRYADSQIRKAALSLGNSRPEHQGPDWWRHIEHAANALAAAWLIEETRSAGAREEQAAREREAKRIRDEQEAALKLNARRIKELSKIIADASSAENLLAAFYDAFQKHTAAEAARRELTQMRNAAHDAARALGKAAPQVSVPPPPENAVRMATAIHQAHNAMPSRG